MRVAVRDNTERLRERRLPALVVLCALLCLLALAVAALRPAGAANAVAPAAFDYAGDAVDFIAANGEQFGMYRRQDGSSFEYVDGLIHIEHVTSNKTVYAGFYLEADKDDPATWDASKFYPRNESGWLTFDIDASYAGKAWPVAPVKVSDTTATTSGQYYLAVPALEKIPGYVAPDDGGSGSGSEDASSDAADSADESGNGGSSADSADGNSADAADAADSADAADAGNSADAADPGVDALAAVRSAIAALPADPKTLLRDTGNEVAASAGAQYLALSDELKAKLTSDERLHLAQCAIAVLPSDPFKVASEHKDAITRAEVIFNSLPDTLQTELDSEDRSKAISSSRSYGRYLENAVWALDALRVPNNVTLLKAGTYTGQVASTSSMGKSTSPRSIAFTVASVTVEGGLATARLEHGSNSSQSLKIGGVEYQNLQTDSAEHSYYEIPINLNSTFHFSVKGKDATDDTDAITYEMTVSATEAAMVPDVAGQTDGGDGGEDGGSSDGEDSSDTSSSSESDDTTSSSATTSTTNTTSTTSSSSTSGKTSTSGSSSKKSSSTSAAALRAPASNGAAITSTRQSSSGSSGTAGSLSSLLRTSSRDGTAASSSPSSSASKKTGSSSSENPATTLYEQASVADATDNVRVTELSTATGPDEAQGDSQDLAPAVAGAALLFMALGALAFALRFIQREGPLA